MNSAERRRVRKTEWDRANRAPCKRCGKPRGTGTAVPSRNGGDRFCLACRSEERRKGRDERRRAIETLWNEGLTAPEIAVLVGTTAKTISVEISRMRDAGYNLPRRYSA